MRKMTAKQLKYRIDKGLKKHDLKLRYGFGYLSEHDGAVCAIGAALSFAASSTRELLGMLQAGDRAGDHPGGSHIAARAAAKILNHGLTPRDMVALEIGFENYSASSFLNGKTGLYGAPVSTSLVEQNPFYKLGRKLREKALKQRDKAA